MPVLVVGSIALDTIRTPDKKEYKNVPGGSCTYFSLCASFLTPVRVVSVVGGDFPKKYISMMEKHDIDLAGLEIRKGEKTFQWHGTYMANMNDRVTDKLEFGVLGGFNPVLPESYRSIQHVFLACSQPKLQLRVIDQMRGSPLVVSDTIAVYIKNDRKDLDKLIKRSNGLIVNDEEARMLCGDDNLIRCAKEILRRGPQFAIIKKGEHGCILADRDGMYPYPAHPLAKVADPTGAGDSFAGGFMGYLAKTRKADSKTLRRAIAYATAAGSYTCEGVALTRLAKLTAADIKERADAFMKMIRIP